MTDIATYKQPHEDVHGTDRDDLLLSLDTAALPHRDALVVLANHLHRATMVGQPAPIVHQMHVRITRPQVGDLVCEVSAVYLRHRDGPNALQQRLQGLGILLEHRMEWANTDEEWERERETYGLVDESERMREEAWYVQYGSSAADVCRWRDAQFIALPRNLHDFG
jgi:hypothetical protein